MTQNNPKSGSQAKAVPRRKSRFVHWLQVVVMFLSGGFIFPHALSEDVDIAKQSPVQNVEAKKS